MNKTVRILLTIVAMFFMAQAPLYAQDTQAEKPADIVVYVMFYPPNTTLTSEGKIEGPWVDNITEFLDKTDLTYEVKSIPWERSYLEATTKDNVLIAHLDRTIEREEQFHWLLQLSTMTYSLIARNEPKFRNATLEEIIAGDDMAACIKASAPCEILKNIGIPENRIIEFPDFVGLIVAELVLKRRAAFMLEDFNIISKRVAELQLPENSLISLFDVQSITSYLAVGKNINPDILTRLQQATETTVD